MPSPSNSSPPRQLPWLANSPFRTDSRKKITTLPPARCIAVTQVWRGKEWEMVCCLSLTFPVLSSVRPAVFYYPLEADSPPLTLFMRREKARGAFSGAPYKNPKFQPPSARLFGKQKRRKRGFVTHIKFPPYKRRGRAEAVGNKKKKREMHFPPFFWGKWVL